MSLVKLSLLISITLFTGYQGYAQSCDSDGGWLGLIFDIASSLDHESNQDTLEVNTEPIERTENTVIRGGIVGISPSHSYKIPSFESAFGFDFSMFFATKKYPRISIGPSLFFGYHGSRTDQDQLNKYERIGTYQSILTADLAIRWKAFESRFVNIYTGLKAGLVNFNTVTEGIYPEDDCGCEEQPRDRLNTFRSFSQGFGGFVGLEVPLYNNFYNRFFIDLDYLSSGTNFIVERPRIDISGHQVNYSASAFKLDLIAIKAGVALYF